MSETQTEFPATLDLSSADTRGNFMENGWKEARISEVTPILTDNPDGALPVGTPGINVMFTIDGGPYDNRKVWNRYWFPPTEGYDQDKRAKTLGMFARFLIAIGYDEAEVKSEGFNLDIADMIGRECRVNTKYNEDYDNVNVSGVKPRVAGGEAAQEGAGLL